MKKTIIGILVILALLSLAFLTGCSNGMSDEEVQTLVNERVQQAEVAKDDKIANLQDELADIKANSTELASEKEKLAKEKETLAIELEAMKAEEQAKEELKTAKANEVFYLVDKVLLDGNFADRIDSDDFEKLGLNEVEFDNEDYDVEEVLIISDAVRPVFDIEDKGAEIFVEVSEKGAIEYRVEFEEAVDFNGVNDDEDDELEFSFLGETVYISKYDNNEITFYRGEEQFVKEGDTVMFGDAKVSLITVNNEKAFVLVEYDGVVDSDVLYEDRAEDVAGVEIRVKDLFDNEESAGFATIAVSVEDVEYEVKDGDEYEADDRFEWIVEGVGTELEAVGLRFDEELTDDDEVLALEDSVCLPNDYICFTFEEISDADYDVIEFSLSSDEIDVSYDEKIEFDGKRVLDDSIVFNVASGTAITFDYETSTEEYEDISVSELSKFVIFAGDRELGFELDSSELSVVDVKNGYGKEYTFAYVTGSDHEFSDALNDASTMDDEEDVRIDNGDILFKSDVSDSDEEEDTVSVGFVSDEDVELTLRVE